MRREYGMHPAAELNRTSPAALAVDASACKSVIAAQDSSRAARRLGCGAAAALLAGGSGWACPAAAAAGEPLHRHPQASNRPRACGRAAAAPLAGAKGLNAVAMPRLRLRM